MNEKKNKQINKKIMIYQFQYFSNYLEQNLLLSPVGRHKDFQRKFWSIKFEF